MGKRTVTKEETVTSADRPHYGRVYLSSSRTEDDGQRTYTVPLYRGVIWHGQNGRLLHDTSFCPDPAEAYGQMKAHAEGMGEPVQLWRHGPNGNVIADLVGSDLPF